MAAYANNVDPERIAKKATGASFRADCFNLSGKTGAFDPPQAFTFNQIKDGYEYKEDKTIMVEPGDLVFITWGKSGIARRDKFDRDNMLPYHTCEDSFEVPISHVGIVEEFHSNGDGTYTICTIEGNTGTGSGHVNGIVKQRNVFTIKGDGSFDAGTILYFGKPNYGATSA